MRTPASRLARSARGSCTRRRISGPQSTSDHSASRTQGRSFSMVAGSTSLIRDSNASSATTSSNLRQHALRGAATGLTYGIVERLFASVVPWLLKPAYVYQPPNHAAVIALLALYALAGAMLQIFLASILRSVRREAIDVLVRMAVVALFALSFVMEYLPPFLLRTRKI